MIEIWLISALFVQSLNVLSSYICEEKIDIIKNGFDAEILGWNFLLNSLEPR